MGHDDELLATSGNVGGGPINSNGSLVYDEFTTLTGFSTITNGNSVITQETFDSASVFKYTDTGYNASNVAQSQRDYPGWSEPADKLVATIRLYVTKLNTIALYTSYTTGLDIRHGISGAERLNAILHSDSVEINGDSGNVSIPYAVPVSTWFRLTIVKDLTTKLCDVYINDSKIGANIPNDRTLSTTVSGRSFLTQVDVVNEVPRNILYTDYLKIGDGLAV